MTELNPNADDPYLITVTGSKHRTGKTVPLKVFEWDAGSGNWTVKLDTTSAITAHLSAGDDPITAADKVVSAMLSQRHGRLASNGTVWRFGKTSVPVVVMNVVLNALRRANRPDVELDDIKSVQSQYGSQIKSLIGLSVEARQHAEQALYTVILERCSILD